MTISLHMTPPNAASDRQVPRGRAVEAETDWLVRKEAARFMSGLGYTVEATTLAKWASNNNAGKGPSFTRFSWRCVKYLRSDLRAWVLARMQRVP